MNNLKLFKTSSDFEVAKSNFEYPMISYTEDTSQVYINGEKNYLIATYDIHSTNTPTTFLSEAFDSNQLKTVYIDGIEVGPNIEYLFSTTGEHQAKIVFNELTSCHAMFGLCSILTSVDLSNFDTSKVTDMSDMFNQCTNLTSLDGFDFDTSNVTDMQNMFYGCTSLRDIDLQFNTSNVTDFSNMFAECTNLTNVSLSFDMTNAEYTEYMFESCTNLLELTIIGGVNPKVSTEGMFEGVSTNGTFWYDSDYDVSAIIKALPSTWSSDEIGIESA